MHWFSFCGSAVFSSILQIRIFLEELKTFDFSFPFSPCLSLRLGRERERRSNRRRAVYNVPQQQKVMGGGVCTRVDGEQCAGVHGAGIREAR
jgi:hypothetical protein